jgi:GT2 family glycosyltransferase
MVQSSPQAEQPRKFSVVICTYNRYTLVRAALASLRDQTLSPDYYEVIVVDNGSSDGTYHRIAYDIKQLSDGELWSARCLLEPRNGLAYARAAGLNAATGEFIVFIDDDTIASPAFLENLLAAYEETGADAIGGRVLLYWEADRPFWLADDLLHELGYFSPGERLCALPGSMSFSSCCFSVRRHVLQQVGIPSPLLSKRLHVPAHMESEDLCQRIRQAGYKLWYAPRALVLHRVHAARLQRSFFIGRAYWQGRAEVLQDYLHHHTLSHEVAVLSLAHVLREIQPELRVIMRSLFWQRPLLALAGKPTLERLLAAMVQEYHWGRLQQKLQEIISYRVEREPVSPHAPSTLLLPLYPYQLYTKQREGVYGLSHLVLRDYYQQLPERNQALARFGLPATTGFVYLCLATMHTGDEILYCIAAFTEAYMLLHKNLHETPSPLTNPQLLIIGRPLDSRSTTLIMKRAARHPSIHLKLSKEVEASEDELLWGLAAANALVMPHYAWRGADMPEIATLGYAYGLTVIAPDLPRVRGMLPPHAAFLFDPAKRKSFVRALLAARTHRFQLSAQEAEALHIEQSWKQYVSHIRAIHH